MCSARETRVRTVERAEKYVLRQIAVSVCRHMMPRSAEVVAGAAAGADLEVRRCSRRLVPEKLGVDHRDAVAHDGCGIMMVVNLGDGGTSARSGVGQADQHAEHLPATLQASAVVRGTCARPSSATVFVLKGMNSSHGGTARMNAVVYTSAVVTSGLRATAECSACRPKRCRSAFVLSACCKQHEPRECCASTDAPDMSTPEFSAGNCSKSNWDNTLESVS